MKEMRRGGMPVVDLSNCSNACEAMMKLMSSPNPCVVVDNGAYATSMRKPEPSPRFGIGDIVRMNRKMLDYLGVMDDGKSMVVIGIDKMPHSNADCYVYKCAQGNDEWSFTGNELELVRRMKDCIMEL